MICQKCKQDFPESEIQESHDIPTYIFEGKRNERKKEADRLGRHHLCKKCHDIYEKMVFSEMVSSFKTNPDLQEVMIHKAKIFSKRFFDAKQL